MPKQVPTSRVATQKLFIGWKSPALIGFVARLKRLGRALNLRVLGDKQCVLITWPKEYFLGLVVSQIYCIGFFYLFDSSSGE